MSLVSPYTPSRFDAMRALKSFPSAFFTSAEYASRSTAPKPAALLCSRL